MISRTGKMCGACSTRGCPRPCKEQGGVVGSDKHTGWGRGARYTVICSRCHLSAGPGLHTPRDPRPLPRPLRSFSSREGHQGAPAQDRVPGDDSCSPSRQETGPGSKTRGAGGYVAEAEPFPVTHHFLHPCPAFRPHNLINQISSLWGPKEYSRPGGAGCQSLRSPTRQPRHTDVGPTRCAN